MASSDATRGAPAGGRRVPASLIVALTLACVFFVPLVPLFGVVLGVGGVRRAPRGGRARRVALAAIIVGATLTAVQATAAAIVVPRLLGLMRRSRAAEGPMALGVMQTQLQSLSAHHVPLPRGDTGWTPHTPCCRQPGHRCTNRRAAWGNAIWRILDYRAYGTQHGFQYRYRSADGVTALFEARGDLDCDGVYSSYQLRVRRRGKTLSFSRRVERPYE